MNNKNYRVMKFFEPLNKQDKSRGYVRLDMRGIKGNIIVSAENLGDVKSTSEVYLYKDRANKIKLGDINNKKGMLKKILTFGNNNAIEDYNVCAVVKNNKIVLYANLFNPTSLEQIKKLEADDSLAKEVANLETEIAHETTEPAIKEPVKPVIGEEKEVKEVKEEKEEKEEKAEKTEKTEKVEKVENEAFAEVSAEEKIEAVIENDRIRKTSVSTAVDLNERPEPTQHSEPEKQENIKSQGRKFRNKYDESLYNVLKDYKQVEPLSVKIKDFYWWYIPYDESGMRNGFLPYYSQIVSSYYPYPVSNRVTTCSSLMKKYGHYIFGIYEEQGDIVKFVYGIPGEFTKEEQPYKGITGFKNWSYSNKENNDQYGYWLAFVNPKTGEATEPPQIVLN